MTKDADEQLDTLMARLADGDRSVFADVFRCLWTPTLRFCISLLKHEADAADAAQQAMAKILDRAGDYDRERPALPWALAIAAWECRTLRQWRSRRREISADSVEPTGEDAEQEVLNRDLVSAALTALGDLSAADRETLIATFWDEAPSAAGPTMRKRRERALKRLRMAFRRLYGIGD
jgi:RNA polymerase sigma-70 factor (ECF subfamily)